MLALKLDHALLAGFMLLPFAIACGDNLDPNCQRVDGEPLVVLGTGDGELFKPIVENEELPLWSLQGGQLFAVSLQMEGLVPGNAFDIHDECNPEIIFSVFHESGERIDGQFRSRQGFDETEKGYVLLRHIPVFIEGDTEAITALYGQTVRLRVDVTDADGNFVRDELPITVLEGIY